MKHIIPFNESESNQYYTEIDLREDIMLNKRILPFVQKEETMIISLAHKKEAMYMINHYKKCITVSKGRIQIDINKYPDEWYIIRSSYNLTNNLYKCDQIEGVLKFIEDKI